MPKLVDHSGYLPRYLQSIRPCGAAYRYGILSFIGIRNADGIEVIQGRLVLQAQCKESVSQEVLVETNSIIGARISKSFADESFEVVIRKLIEEGWVTTLGIIRIPPNSNDDSIAVYFQDHSFGTEVRDRRMPILSLSGSSQQKQVDAGTVMYELMAAARPYESISELANELSIPAVRFDRGAQVDVVAESVVSLEDSSRVYGERADIVIRLAPALDTAQCKVGYKLVVGGKTIAREQVPGEAFSWERRQEGWTGVYSLPVPAGAALQCFVTYAGQPQHLRFISDPDTSPNFRRTIHAAFDQRLEVLQTYLFDEKHQKSHSRDLEAGVANLLFMLGFSVNPLMGKPLEEGPDILAVTKNGDILAVECTTGQINKSDKMSKLVDRVEVLRASLIASSCDQRVLPVMVTSRPQDAIAEADKKAAIEQGILVLAKEDLISAIERTALPPDSDLLFKQYIDSLVMLRAASVTGVNQIAQTWSISNGIS